MAWYRLCYGKQDYPFNYSEFIIDNEDDIENLPTNKTSPDGLTCCFGSPALSVDDGEIYVLTTNGWTKVGGGESEKSTTNAAQVQTLSMSPLNINRGELTGGVNLEDETEIKPEAEESEAEESEESEEPEVENTTVEELR